MTLHEHLKHELAHRGESAEHLALSLGISESTLHSILDGEASLDHALLVKLQQHWDLPGDSFLTLALEPAGQETLLVSQTFTLTGTEAELEQLRAWLARPGNSQKATRMLLTALKQEH